MLKTHSLGEVSPTAALRLPVSPTDRRRARELIGEALKLVPPQVAADFLVAATRRSATRADKIIAKLELQGDLDKLEIERLSGTPLSTEQVAERLKVTAETVRSRIAKNALIGYRAAYDRTKLCLPPWQFDARGHVRQWVIALLKAFGANGWGLVDFVTVARAPLDGRNYLALLESGEPAQIAQVLAAAQRTDAD